MEFGGSRHFPCAAAGLIAAGILVSAAEAATIRFDVPAPGAGAPYLEAGFRFEPALLGGEPCLRGGCAVLEPGAALTMTRADGGAFRLASLAFAFHGSAFEENEARGDVLNLRKALAEAQAVAATAATNLAKAVVILNRREEALLLREAEASEADLVSRFADKKALLARKLASDALDERDALGAEATRLNQVQVAAKTAAEAAEARVLELEAAAPTDPDGFKALAAARLEAARLRKEADVARDAARDAAEIASLAFDTAAAAVETAIAAEEAALQAALIAIAANAEAAKAQALVNGAEIQRDIAALERDITDRVAARTFQESKAAEKRLEALTASLTLTAGNGTFLVFASGDFLRGLTHLVTLSPAAFGVLDALTFAAGPGGVATIEALSTVPLPAAGWMLLAALGGLSALRSRRI